MLEIFCPQCDALILEQPVCPNPACGWRRPVVKSEVGARVWSADLGARLNKPHCYPVVAGEYYYIGTENGTVLAINAQSGEVVWELPLEDGVMASGLAADAERLFVGGEDVRSLPIPGRELLALDLRSGDLLWRAPTEAHSLSAAAVTGEAVYFSASDGHLRAVDARTGHLIWAVEHPHWSPTPPVTDAGVICVGGRANTVIAYNIANGAELWRFSARGWFAHPLYIWQDRLYALAWDEQLYVLDLHTGTLLWQARGERGRGFTTPPALGAGQVFLGSRVNRAEGEQVTPGYALLAFDAESGAEIWRYYTDKHILSPLRCAGGRVFCGANDGTFYAVDAQTGEEQWRWQVKSRAVTWPQLIGDLVLFGGRDGMIHAVRWQEPPSVSAEALEAAGDYLEAAATYALRGDLELAAALYAQRLQQPQAAARLYEQAGNLAQAAEFWQAGGNLRQARELYVTLDDKNGQAVTSEHLGEFLLAARLREELEEYAEAARLYELAGNRQRAMELYRQARKWSEMYAISETLGAWEKQVEALLGLAKKAEAAALLEEHEKWERAAALYEEAEQFAAALRLRQRLQHWEHVITLAQQAGNLLAAAQAHEALKQWKLAAETYVQAAFELRQQGETLPASIEAEIATLYEKAAHLYSEKLFDDAGAATMHKFILRFRRLPDISVEVRAEDAFIENQYNILKLHVTNQGYSVARDIEISLEGRFDILSDDCCISGLAPERSKSLEISLRPQKDHYGPKVPLKLTLNYYDQHRELYTSRTEAHIFVAQAGLLGSLGSTPTPMHVHIGTYQPGATNIQGHQVQAGGHVGDETKITRYSSESHITRDSPVRVRPGAENVRRCPACNLPTSDSEQRYCSDCGTPLPLKTQAA